MVSLSDKKVTCIEANNTISSFSPVDHTLLVNFQEGESCLLQCASMDVPDLCSNIFEKALLPNINNDTKPRMVYFDDILIYSKTIDEHIDHLRVVFNALCDAHLFGNLEKCTFCTDRVSFLGYVVTP
jgi:hypothetical protein